MVNKKGSAKKTAVPKQNNESTQVNFKVAPAEVYNKIRLIAENEVKPYNDIYNLAFAKFVELYEKANGEVKPRKSGLDKL